jgi:hypothetical protein
MHTSSVTISTECRLTLERTVFPVIPVGTVWTTCRVILQHLVAYYIAMWSTKRQWKSVAVDWMLFKTILINDSVLWGACADDEELFKNIGQGPHQEKMKTEAWRKCAIKLCFCKWSYIMWLVFRVEHVRLCWLFMISFHPSMNQRILSAFWMKWVHK